MFLKKPAEFDKLLFVMCILQKLFYDHSEEKTLMCGTWTLSMFTQILGNDE